MPPDPQSLPRLSDVRDEDGVIIGAFDLFHRLSDDERWAYMRTVRLGEQHRGRAGMTEALRTVDLAGGDPAGQWISFESYGEDSVVIPRA